MSTSSRQGRNKAFSGEVDTGSPSENATTEEHFQAKHALGLDPRVDTGSPSENAATESG
jgi:hypothetical protein